MLAVGATDSSNRWGVVYVNSMVNLLPDISVYTPQELKASDGAVGDGFGVSLAITNDSSLLIGAPFAQCGESKCGAVYIFKQNKSGVWKQVSRVGNPTGALGGSFGASVASHGGLLAIGAPAQLSTGELFTDETSLASAPAAAEDSAAVANTSRSYGEKYAFFDTVPHALVSSLLFIVLPLTALSTIVYGRKPIVDYVSNGKWKFKRLDGGEGLEEEGHLSQRRVFVSEGEKRPNPLRPDLEETHELIRV